MDVRFQMQRSGPALHPSWTKVLVLSALILCGTIASPGVSAQILEIRASGGEQSIRSDLTHKTQTFPEVEWSIFNQIESDGIAVIWTADAFTGDPQTRQQQVDVGLDLRMTRDGRRNAWSVTRPHDTTHLAGGDSTAEVIAVSARAADGTAAITVRFEGGDPIRLAAGSYSTVVVGTIAPL
ncbi:MAG: hypothetical protein KDA85_05550 [Planctomycetaceae bacterium]|nr:hypothetical protein [Planctomycetaceae bacterium]